MQIEIDETDLALKIRDRLRKEAKNLTEWDKLVEENPRLFNLCADLDNMISLWAIEQLRKTKKEERYNAIKNQKETINGKKIKH